MGNEVDFSLLDGSVDDLADLKGFEPLPPGSYVLGINWSRKDINDMPAVILKLTTVDVLAMSDASEPAPEPGKSSDIAFILKFKEKDGTVCRNEVAEGQLKEVIKVLAPVFGDSGNPGGSKIADIMAASEGANIAATLKIRVDKKDPDRKYNSIKSCTLA